MSKKMTQEEFLTRVLSIHGDKIDFSESFYDGDDTHVTCKCNVCGNIWKATPHKLKIGRGCPKCGIKKVWEKREDRTTKETIIKRMNEVFPDYNFSDNEAITNQRKKIKIICPKHGEFEASPDNILHGHGCPKCGLEKNRHTFSFTKEEFIEKSVKIHSDKYDYSKVKYINTDTKVCIICPEHGEFWQTPYQHVNMEQGCPVCKESHLEKEVRLKLNDLNLLYEEFKHFDWLGRQHLDFYLPECNIAIECQGRQHYEPVSFTSDKTEETMEGNLEEIRRRDKRKMRLCKENGVNLIYFTHYGKVKEDGINIFKNTEKLIEYVKHIDGTDAV